MSRENIEAVVDFKTRDGEVLTYSYGKVATKKILQGRDPVDFKAAELTK
jgi:hypothetical protein